MKSIVVCGAGGFIGGHLVAKLLGQGHRVRAVDIKPRGQWHQRFEGAESLRLDLRVRDHCRIAVHEMDQVYNLAADMGGMGFIERHKAACMLSVLINTHLLMASRDVGVERYFFASSACVYNADKQRSPAVVPLCEDDAYPAMAEDGYGWEKLFSERMCRHFREDFGLETRVARFHNVYGSHGTWDGGREKAPAAMIRKVIEAKLSDKLEIEIWGDGKQTRSFMHVDDCIRGIELIMHSECSDPLNLGSSELVSIDALVDIVEEVAGLKLERRYDLAAPKGVNGRNSDNTRILAELGWEPSVSLRAGIGDTYRWIHEVMTGKVPEARAVSATSNLRGEARSDSPVPDPTSARDEACGDVLRSLSRPRAA
jgi:nucleoside-diphosphate-sugar epimerase